MVLVRKVEYGMRLASVLGVSSQLSCKSLSGSSQRKLPTMNYICKTRDLRDGHYITGYHRFKIEHTNLEISWKHVLKFAFLSPTSLLGLLLTIHWFRIHYIIPVRVGSYTYTNMKFSLRNVWLFYCFIKLSCCL